MKLTNSTQRRNLLRGFFGVAALGAGLAALPAQAEEAPASFVSGTLNLSVNTHFVSYGQDVWGAGTSWRDPLFQPSVELSFDLGKGFKGILGTWWDVNDNATSSIGGHGIQEVDVWVGLGYSVENFSFTVLYQEWLYAGQSERILDFKVGYSHWLNPSLTIHSRLEGARPFSPGIVVVAGLAPSHDLGPVTLSFPVNISYDTHNFHGGDAGIGFVSAGVGASVPLKFLPGDWTFNAGVTYYHTHDDVIRVNPKSDFLVGSTGLTLTF